MKKKLVIPLALVLLVTAVAMFFMFTSIEPEPKEITITLAKTRSNPNVMTCTDGTPTTLSTYIKMSTDCFIGKFISYKDYEDMTEYEFQVTKKIFGNSNDKIVRVRNQKYGYSTEGNIRISTFKPEHEYLLLVSKSETLFLEYPQYSFMGHIVLDFSDIENARWEEGALVITENANKVDISNHIKELSEEIGISTPNIIKFYRTEDVETVIKNCDLVLKIKPRMLIADGIYISCSTYFCEVSDCLKGNYTTNQNGMVMIRTFKDALDSGDEVIIALSNTAADSFYDQASPICVFTEDDIGIEAQIDLWLSETE